MDAPSELEGAVLAYVSHHPDCTPYAVRKEFAASLTSQFSGSAGAIYPLMRRLEARGLFSTRTSNTGRRPSVTYRLTRKGRSALRRWIGPPLGDTAQSITYDPLRTRMLVLDALNRDEQVRWLTEAEEQLVALLDRIDAVEHHAEGRTFAELATRNARLDTHARLKWIREARERLDG